MNTVIERYSDRADIYHRYRWPYADEAIDALISGVGLEATSTVADIGAGTGLLTRHFVDRVQRVYAIEPNSKMRAIAETELGGAMSFCSLNQSADATGLAASSIDLIVVGRAIHWFPAAETQTEFRRILKPTGQLAICAVEYADSAVRAQLDDVLTPENGYRWEGSKHAMIQRSAADFFGQAGYSEFASPQVQIEDWPRFLGRLLSLSPAPGPNDELYPRFKSAARKVFDGLAVDGLIHIKTMTTTQTGCIKHK